MLDVFDEPQAVHLVLEVCKGGELFDRIIDKGYYSEQDAAKCIKQVYNNSESWLNAIRESSGFSQDESV